MGVQVGRRLAATIVGAIVAAVTIPAVPAHAASTTIGSWLIEFDDRFWVAGQTDFYAGPCDYRMSRQGLPVRVTNLGSQTQSSPALTTNYDSSDRNLLTYDFDQDYDIEPGGTRTGFLQGFCRPTENPGPIKVSLMRSAYGGDLLGEAMVNVPPATPQPAVSLVPETCAYGYATAPALGHTECSGSPVLRLNNDDFSFLLHDDVRETLGFHRPTTSATLTKFWTVTKGKGKRKKSIVKTAQIPMEKVSTPLVEDGWFSLPPLAPGRYIVHAMRDSTVGTYCYTAAPWVCFEKGATGGAAGVVFDFDGTAITGQRPASLKETFGGKYR